MIRNGALDDEEKHKFCVMIFEQLLRLCAPIHDEHVKAIRDRVSTSNVGELIFEANMIVDQIKFLQSEFEKYHHTNVISNTNSNA